MARFISTSKAAHLAGVRERDIKAQIDRGALSIVRGQILVDDLMELYPELALEDTDILSKTQQIKEDAVSKDAWRESQRWDPAMLREELKKVEREAGYYRRRSEELSGHLSDLRSMLEELQRWVTEKHKIEGVIRWIDKKLNRK